MPTGNKIERSWKSTFINLGIGVACAGLATYLFMSGFVEGPISLGVALLPSIAALIFFYMAYAGAGTGICPLCNKTLTSIGDGGGPTCCDGCHKYLDTKDKTLTPTDESTIAETPTFSSPLPEKFAFPEGCCICGKPSDHREKIQTRSMNASSAVTAGTIGVTTTTTVTVEVPHCPEHKGGAELSGISSSTTIRFRSYPYLRAFCELNQTKPG